MAHAIKSTQGIIELIYHYFAIVNRLINLGNIIKEDIITHYAPPNDKTHCEAVLQKKRNLSLIKLTDSFKKHRRQNMLNYIYIVYIYTCSIYMYIYM